MKFEVNGDYDTITRIVGAMKNEGLFPYSNDKYSISVNGEDNIMVDIRYLPEFGEVPEFTKEVGTGSECFLKVSAGTTGYISKDNVNGGKAFIRIDTENADIEIDSHGTCVDFIVKGNNELSTIIESFEFITRTLKTMAGEKDITRYIY